MKIKMLDYPNTLYPGRRKLLDKSSILRNLSFPIKLSILRKFQIINKKIIPSYKLIITKIRISCYYNSQQNYMIIY